MRSDWRGVARGTQPNRSTSARGPPVCINSMAQQARPNSMYHCDEARPQLSKLSTFVVNTVSGSELSSGFTKHLQRQLGLCLDLFYPLQIPFGPGINQAEKEDPHKNQDLHEGKEPISALDPAPKSGRYWKDKNDLYLKDDKNQRNDIKADVEIDPGATTGGFSTLIGRKFAHLWILGSDQPADKQG